MEQKKISQHFPNTKEEEKSQTEPDLLLLVFSVDFRHTMMRGKMPFFLRFEARHVSNLSEKKEKKNVGPGGK